MKKRYAYYNKMTSVNTDAYALYIPDQKRLKINTSSSGTSPPRSATLIFPKEVRSDLNDDGYG